MPSLTPRIQTPSIQNEQELLRAFRPRDQKHVILPKTLRFPLPIGHYLAWTEPSGARVYLVFKKVEWKSPIGVAFRRDQDASASSPPGLCEWCLTQGSSDRVGLLSATVDSKRRVGIYLCRDLDCLLNLEDAAGLGGLSLDKLVAKLHEKMARFCEEALGMRWE